jgi:membrane-bound lytic murein transglycosylase B
MRFIKLLLLLLLFSLGIVEAKNYNNKREVKNFINMMVKKHHFKRSKLQKLFKNVKFQRGALGMFNPKYRRKPKHPPKHYPKHGSWDRYEKIMLGPTRVKKGVKYMHDYRSIFKKVYRRYGVPPEYITAIIGIESYYGYNRGKFPAFDVLTTLGFEPNRRQKYFRYELKNFLLLSRSEKFNPKNVKSSFAGAIGLGQFMPSSYDAFAVDFNKDGRRSIQTTSDAIASIANYFKKNGWRKGETVGTRVSYQGNRFYSKKTGYKHSYYRNRLAGISPKYGSWSYNKKVRLIKLDRYNYDELWYGAKNFYVITRYNHSSYYAMAVHQLAQKIKKSYKKTHGTILR